MLQMVNMKYPKQLLERIEAYRLKKGFATRSQTIVYLLQKALEKE